MRLLLFVFLFFGAQLISAQDLSLRLNAVYTVEMKDGNIVEGTLKEIQSEIIILEDSEGDKIEVPKSDIKSVKLYSLPEIQSTIKTPRNIRYSNASEIRYFLNSSGYGLRRAEGYYQNSYIFINSINYGVTDWFSMGFAFDWYTLAVGQPFFAVIPKFSIPVARDVQLGVNLAYVHSFIEEWGGIAAFLPQITYGTPSRNITAGFGYAIVVNDGQNLGVINLSGMYALNHRFSLVSESYFTIFTSGDGFITSNGIRIQANRLSFDLGLLKISDIDSWPVGIPYGGFAVKF